MTLIFELEGVRQEVEANSARAITLCDGLTEEELARRPTPGRWSIAENLIHLLEATDIYLPSLDASMEHARRQGFRGEGPFRPGYMGRLLIWYMEPPARFKSAAPKQIVPRLEGSAMDALPLFLNAQHRLLERVHRANGIHLTKARLTSPLMRSLRMDLLSAFRILAAHQRRHLHQAEQIREQVRYKLQNVA